MYNYIGEMSTYKNYIYPRGNYFVAGQSILALLRQFWSITSSYLWQDRDRYQSLPVITTFGIFKWEFHRLLNY